MQPTLLARLPNITQEPLIPIQSFINRSSASIGSEDNAVTTPLNHPAHVQNYTDRMVNKYFDYSLNWIFNAQKSDIGIKTKNNDELILYWLSEILHAIREFVYSSYPNSSCKQTISHIVFQLYFCLIDYRKYSTLSQQNFIQALRQIKSLDHLISE